MKYLGYAIIAMMFPLMALWVYATARLAEWL